MVMNILVPDAGSIRILGQPVSDKAQELIGYLPEERGLYPRMHVRASVNRFAGGIEAKLKPGADSQEILKAAVQSGAEITRFELLKPSLNEIFIEETTRA